MMFICFLWNCAIVQRFSSNVAENEKQYRVVQKKPDGKIQDVARLTSREKAQYYIDVRTQQEASEHNQW